MSCQRQDARGGNKKGTIKKRKLCSSAVNNDKYWEINEFRRIKMLDLDWRFV